MALPPNRHALCSALALHTAVLQVVPFPGYAQRIEG